MVNVRAFGAVGDGVADDQPAFQAAIDSFGTAGNSLAGRVIVPKGRYRFARPLRVKKAVWIQGSQGMSVLPVCQILPDLGVDGIVFERYNTPTDTTDSGAGDNAQLSNLMVFPSGKVADWRPNRAYSVDDRVRTGTGRGEDWRRHYICTQAGTSASSGAGPRSLGNDKLLNYRAQAANFHLGQYLTGASSRATGGVIADTDSGSTGQLRLTSVAGAFVDGEVIFDPLGGSATADGGSSAATSDELDGGAKWRYLSSGAGIKIRANGVTIRDVAVLQCSGNGIHIEAQDPREAPGALANANSWHLQNVSVWQCDGHGLYVNGSDTNGGSFLHGVMFGNGGALTDEDFTGTGYNIYESSFLGNTYVSIQMASGGLGSIFHDSVGGGSTFIGCYVEGSGGGSNVAEGSVIIVGGGLSLASWRSKTGGVSAAVRVGPLGRGGGLGQQIVGFGGPPWRRDVDVILGDKRSNGGNLYQVITAGHTAASGGPSGTGADILDGTAHWAFVHATTFDGGVWLGSTDVNYKSVMSWQAPDEINVGLATYLRYEDSTTVASPAYTFRYAISGPNSVVDEGNGLGLMLAANKTVLNEWPYKVPVGKAIFDQFWMGGCRVAFTGTAADPTFGTWNRG